MKKRAAKSASQRANDMAKAKPVSASASEMAEVVLPAQTSALGKLLGGHVMHMVDIVAAMAARVAKKPVRPRQRVDIRDTFYWGEMDEAAGSIPNPVGSVMAA